MLLQVESTKRVSESHLILTSYPPHDRSCDLLWYTRHVFCVIIIRSFSFDIRRYRHVLHSSCTRSCLTWANNHVIFLWACTGKVNIKMYILTFVFLMSPEVTELYLWGNPSCEFCFANNQTFCILKHFKESCIVRVFMTPSVALIFWRVLRRCTLDVTFVKCQVPLWAERGLLRT